MPSQYRFAMAETAGAADTRWWTAFGDPVLDQLVDEALANNEDLRIAAARVDEFHGAQGDDARTALPERRLRGDSRTRSGARSRCMRPGNDDVEFRAAPPA